MSATTATYALSMADLKTETHHGSLWSNYGSPEQMAGRFSSLDSAVSNASPTSPLLARPRGSIPSIPSMDYSPYHYGRPLQDEVGAYDRQHHPSLQAHHSFPNLKRPYAHPEQPPYAEMVQDLRDEGARLGANQDHKLLSFRRCQDKYTIVDQNGRIQQLELSAQLHGMFFLSEMPSSTGDGGMIQPELTCYRRNLFQVSGSLITPRTPLSVIVETGETVPVTSTEVSVSAVESVDGHSVRLIVIPWKTPPPNSPETNQTPDQEPPALPLIPFQNDSPENDGEYAVYPIGWRRLQFRIATANNGRRKELQQHFILHIKVVGTLANESKAVLAEGTTAPIVVRGRSPRNFQARKEIPLLGSSAGSRGQALAETGLGIVAGPLSAKPQDLRDRPLNIELPRTAFTFSAPRSNSFHTTWNQPSQVPLAHIPSSGPSYPTATLAGEPYQKLSISTAANFAVEPQEMHLQTSMPPLQLPLSTQDQHQPPIRNQYSPYIQGSSGSPQLNTPAHVDGSMSVPRYMEDGPRPSKSHRHDSQTSVHSTSPLANDSPPAEYRYGASYVGNSADLGQHGQHPQAYGPTGHDNGPAPSSAAATGAQGRDYFPPTHSWTSAADPTTSSVPYATGGHRSYRPGQGGAKMEAHQVEATLPSPGVYQAPAMSNYSWSSA